jgi:hypothetical protein
MKRKMTYVSNGKVSKRAGFSVAAGIGACRDTPKKDWRIFLVKPVKMNTLKSSGNKWAMLLPMTEPSVVNCQSTQLRRPFSKTIHTRVANIGQIAELLG